MQEKIDFTAQSTGITPIGKPKGERLRTTLAAEALLDGAAEKLTRKAVELALSGDMVALRLCMERILPPRKDQPHCGRSAGADGGNASG